MNPIDFLAALVEKANQPGTNTGHGHVYPRPDGARMRCGGPAMCSSCALDAARKAQPKSAIDNLMPHLIEALRAATAANAAWLKCWQDEISEPVSDYVQVEIDKADASWSSLVAAGEREKQR